MGSLAQSVTPEIACVLIPAGDEGLLLPNVCIAEVLPWRRVNKIKNAPDWCVGMAEWRGQNIPVIRFDVMNKGNPSDDESHRCLVVMNRARLTNGAAFYALAATGLPKILKLSGEDLTNQSRGIQDAEVAAVRVGTENAIIPNLEFVETRVRNLIAALNG
ncbi:MAG: chemotaxis protein CheW [Proteobacteria bacterium]|nr:chemotaxis protein CheW [Pseudomonadota bacterium]